MTRTRMKLSLTQLGRWYTLADRYWNVYDKQSTEALDALMTARNEIHEVCRHEESRLYTALSIHEVCESAARLHAGVYGLATALSALGFEVVHE